MSDEDLKSYIISYYLDRKMTYTKLDKHDRAIGVLLEENKHLKEQLEILLEDNNQLEEIRIKVLEYIEQLPFNDLTPLEVKVIYKILGEKENDNK